MYADLHNNLIPLGKSVARVTDNTAQQISLDLKSVRAVEFFIALGTVADADVTFTTLVEDSSDNTNWTAVDDAFLLGLEANGLQYDSDNKVGKIGYAGGKRYVRLTFTPANNSGNADITLLAVGLVRVGPATTLVS